MRATDLMNAEPRTIDIDATIAEALEAFDVSGQRVLPVLSEGRVVGLLCSRDVRRMLGGLAAASERTLGVVLSLPISDFHAAEGRTVFPEMNVRAVLRRIMDEQLPELPVVARKTGALLGLITSERVLAAAREGWV